MSEPDKQLVRLGDWNLMRRKQLVPSNGETPNGIACPNCAKELVDTNPRLHFLTNPPVTQVACNTCGYTSTRVV